MPEVKDDGLSLLLRTSEGSLGGQTQVTTQRVSRARPAAVDSSSLDGQQSVVTCERANRTTVTDNMLKAFWEMESDPQIEAKIVSEEEERLPRGVMKLGVILLDYILGISHLV
ncbi:unnamed protein product [Arctia plantaginis]|uniref:Uncharacterized protein n=1 Tax=Arctia plantaginis TaxID=874455 RepID=A0A8S1B1F4_ARCPL|nr:unnamed protein product [Arctia plantaginis]